MVLATRTGALVIWVGEEGVRLYSAGQPGGARADKLLWQASIALDPEARRRVVRRMYALRFGEEAPQRRSIDQLRGIEGGDAVMVWRALTDQGFDFATTGPNRPNRWISAA